MQYFDNLWNVLQNIQLTDSLGTSYDAEQGYEVIIRRIKKIENNKIIAIGNGGSAAIASHFVNDLCKTDQIKAVCFSDYAYLTCMSNDYGYDHAYENAIDMFVEEGDILFAISSSGNSANIINAVERAKTKGIYVVGLSGFDENNKLKTCADFNIYVPRNHYGYVELAHQIILHMLTDTLGGVVE